MAKAHQRDFGVAACEGRVVEVLSGGWIAELGIRKAWPEQADRLATLTLAMGVVFAVLLTLSSGVVVGALGLFGLVGHLLGVVHSAHN